MIKKLRDPVSGLTHLFGAIMSIIGLIFLIYVAEKHGTIWHIVTFSVFGASLILLYTASTLYHLLNISEKGVMVLRRIDHSMIYVLITGTYTPISFIALKGVWGISIFSSICVVAITGIFIKSFGVKMPRWFSTLLYLIMGWAVIIAFVPLMKHIQVPGLMWLVAGGIFYTIGGVIYATKWPKLQIRYFGFHEIFHLFVLAGSFCHYMLIVKYLF